MTEKLLAGLVAAVAVAPLCAICVLGPAVMASAFTGLAGWFVGTDAFVTLGLVVVAGTAAFSIVRRRRRHQGEMTPAGDTNK